MTRQEVMESEFIPDRLKPFFEAEVQWWIHTDREARNASRRFDYSHPELSSLITYLEQVQARHAQFEREEFLQILDSAVKLAYNYVCRPQTTLKWYIFRGQPVRPLSEVTIRFGAFSDYTYFRTVFLEWVDRKRAERPTFEAISASEFERVIRRTDDQILLNCNIQELLEIMGPLFEFLGEGPRGVVPVDSLIIFFDDKNIKRLVDRLEGYRDNVGETIGRDEFIAQLDELLTVAEGEPEADFSGVFQNDELDDVVREHLESAQKAAESTLVVAGVAPPVSYSPDETTVHLSEGSIQTPAHISSGASGSGTQTSDADRNREIELDDIQFDDPDAWLDDDDPHPIPSAFEEFADPDDDIELAIDEDDTDLELEQELDLELDHESAMPDAKRGGDVLASDSLDLTMSDAVASSTPGRIDLDHPERGAVQQGSASDVSAINQQHDVNLATTDTNGSHNALPIAAGSSTLLDPTLERKVIKKVFHRNPDLYHAAVVRIMGAASWKSACQVLDEIFIANNVDPYSRTAIRFTDAVYGRFLPGR